MTAVVTGYRAAKLIGIGCLFVTALGWGLNWPATKFLLEQCPPLTARGVSGIVASMALAGLAASRGESLTVPHRLWGRLILASLLNVSAWMGLTTVSLLWLNAGEAATLAYTMPVWTALLAWPILGERLVPRRIAALVLGIGGIAVLVGGNGLNIDVAKLPGVAIVLAAAMLFALGTVFSAGGSRCRRLQRRPGRLASAASRCSVQAPSWSIPIFSRCPGSAGQP